MSPFTDLRTQARTSCRIPLSCSGGDQEHPFPATIRNLSGLGIYLEADREFRPGETIHIRPREEEYEGAGSQLAGEHAGIVRWSRSFRRGRRLVYGAGIRLLMEAVSSLQVWYECDVCGRPAAPDDARLLQSTIRICSSCGDHVDRLGGRLHEAALRYLLGNVL